MTTRLLSLTQALGPLRYLDFSLLYRRYWVVIDLLVYVTIFVGISRAALRQRLPGRGGQAASAGIGLALSFGMVLFEHRNAVNLSAFGPAAVLLVVLLFGLTVHGLLRHAGASAKTALAAGYVATFLVTGAAAPGMGHWLGNRSPLALAVLLLGMVVAIASLGVAMLPGDGGSVPPRPSRGQTYDRSRRVPSRLHRFRAAKQRDMAAASRQIQTAGDRVFRNTRSALHAVSRCDGRPESRQRLAAALLRLDADSRSALPEIRELGERIARLRRLDETAFAEDRRAWIRSQNDEEKALLRKQLHAEIERRGLEKRLARIDEAVRAQTSAVSQHLRESARHLIINQRDEAIRELRSALRTERKMRLHSRELRVLARELYGLAVAGRS